MRIAHRELLVAPGACEPGGVQGGGHAVQALRDLALQMPAGLPVSLFF